MGRPLRRAILRHYNPDSCVASCSIGKLVLDGLDIPSEVVSVKAMLANQQWIERAEREGHVPRNRAETERWFIESGAHAIGLGVPDPKFEGHPSVNGLHVALLVDGNYLWDLSIDQASRPQHGIVILEPFLGDVSHSPYRAKWLKGQTQITWAAPGQGLIVYTIKPNDRRYLQHTNWRSDTRDAGQRKAIAQEALLALRGLYSLSSSVLAEDRAEPDQASRG